MVRPVYGHMPPLTLTTSGGLYFVLIPAVGYTLVDGVTTMVAATAILIIVVSVYRARRRWYIVIACVAVGQPIFARLCLALATLRGLNHSLTEEQCRHDLSHRIKVKHKDVQPTLAPQPSTHLSPRPRPPWRSNGASTSHRPHDTGQYFTASSWSHAPPAPP